MAKHEPKHEQFEQWLRSRIKHFEDEISASPMAKPGYELIRKVYLTCLRGYLRIVKGIDAPTNGSEKDL